VSAKSKRNRLDLLGEMSNISIISRVTRQDLLLHQHHA